MLRFDPFLHFKDPQAKGGIVGTARDSGDVSFASVQVARFLYYNNYSLGRLLLAGA
jgi:hypothetical protein